MLGNIWEHHFKDADPALVVLSISSTFPELLLLLIVDEENLLYRRGARLAGGFLP